MLDHHERLDGSGYPRGLGAPDLDIETRILAVCDVFDALLSKRVYREAWTLDDALELLSKESGTGFDPACVEALERVIAREQHDAAAPPLPEPAATRRAARATIALAAPAALLAHVAEAAGPWHVADEAQPGRRWGAPPARAACRVSSSTPR